MSAAGLPAPDGRLRASVAVPAHDEEAWIGACLDALAAQSGVGEGELEVLVVLDACGDDTAGEVARAAARHPHLAVGTLPGPGRGAGRARGVGMDAAAARLRAVGRPDGLVATTDADSRVAPDWVDAQLALLAAGARVVAGRIELDPAGVPEATLAARARDAATRLDVVRALHPGAEHHQCSGASLGLAAATYAEVGGLPDRAALEDEALEAELGRRGVAVARSLAVRVTTAARTDGRAARGLAQALRLEAWAAARPALGTPARPDPRQRVAVVVPRDHATRPGAALADALRRVPADTEVLVILPPGTARDAHPEAVAALAGALAAPGVLLVQGVPGGATAVDPLTALAVRPALGLHAPDLAALGAPLSPWLALRPALLEDGLRLPAGRGAPLALALAAHAQGGLDALAQVAVPDGTAPAEEPDGATAYALLALVARATAGAGPPEPGTAYVSPTAGGLDTARVDLDEVDVRPAAGSAP